MKYTEDLKTEYTKKLLDTFKSTIQFLDSHQLKWWASSGTAIGAIRHHGMIPWDDDIDIFMPYDDYSRLLKMNNEFDNISIELYRPFEGEYFLPYAKIGDKSSTILQVEYFKFVGGVWIDIFPLYTTNIPIEEYWTYVEKYKKMMYKFIGGKICFVWSDIIGLLRERHIRTLKSRLINFTIHRLFLTKNQKKFERFLNSINDADGHYYMFPFTYLSCLHHFPKEWFNSTIDFDFEDFKVKMPVGYDMVLKSMYGDYMTPPPPEKRLSTHSFCFIDLHKRYSYDEVMKKMKQGGHGNDIGFVSRK